MKLSVYGETIEVKRIGFVANFKPGEDPGPGGVTDDVWEAEDGRKFVEVYITQKWREYDKERFGTIWTEETWETAASENCLFYPEVDLYEGLTDEEIIKMDEYENYGFDSLEFEDNGFDEVIDSLI